MNLMNQLYTLFDHFYWAKQKLNSYKSNKKKYMQNVDGFSLSILFDLGNNIRKTKLVKYFSCTQCRFGEFRKEAKCCCIQRLYNKPNIRQFLSSKRF